MSEDRIQEETSEPGFVQQLWQSIFTPGISPALVNATHASFIVLILVFLTLIFISRPNVRFHFINLLVIAVAFYLVIIWFLRELRAAEAAEAAQKPKSE